VNRRDFQLLSAVRLKEAKALLKAGFPDGAYYLAGYSVECALKACIAKSTQRYDFPDKTRASESYTNNLTQLVKTAKLDATLTTLLNIDILFRDNWEAVKNWSEVARYQRSSGEMAAALIYAIENRKHGVMAWLKQHY
jgi:hypothetical protein